MRERIGRHDTLASHQFVSSEVQLALAHLARIVFVQVEVLEAESPNSGCDSLP